MIPFRSLVGGGHLALGPDFETSLDFNSAKVPRRSFGSSGCVHNPRSFENN